MPHSIDRLLSPVQPRLSPQFNLDYLRYDQRVAYYQKRLGPERVKVLNYEAFLENPRDFLTAIAGFARVKADYTAAIRQTPVEHTVNPGQTLANLHLQRWSNRFFLSGPFNYGGLFKPTPESWERRVRRSRRNRLPGFMDNWFETRFARKVHARTEGLFADSNRRLQRLTGLDLARYGYELEPRSRS